MAVIRTDLNIVKLYVEETWYEILCGKPKITRKQDSNKRIACNSHMPYEINPVEEEVSVEIPEVANHQLYIFAGMMNRQNRGKLKHAPVLVVYRYDSTGKVVKSYHLRGFFIEEMTQEGEQPGDIKGVAINPVYMHRDYV